MDLVARMERSAIRGKSAEFVRWPRIALALHPGYGATNCIYAASMRRKPFHIAVAAPEVRTGRMRASW